MFFKEPFDWMFQKTKNDYSVASLWITFEAPLF